MKTTALDVTAPIVGTLAPSRFPPWCDFETAELYGLVHVRGDRIDVLAILAKMPRRGACRRFILKLKASYSCIVFWQVNSRILADALRRYGFRSGTDQFYDGDGPEDVLRWPA